MAAKTKKQNEAPSLAQMRDDALRRLALERGVDMAKTSGESFATAVEATEAFLAFLKGGKMDGQ